MNELFSELSKEMSALLRAENATYKLKDESEFSSESTTPSASDSYKTIHSEMQNCCFLLQQKLHENGELSNACNDQLDKKADSVIKEEEKWKEQIKKTQLLVCTSIRKLLSGVNDMIDSAQDRIDKEGEEYLKDYNNDLLNSTSSLEYLIEAQFDILEYCNCLERFKHKDNDQLSAIYRRLLFSSFELIPQVGFISMIAMQFYQFIYNLFCGTNNGTDITFENIKELFNNSLLTFKTDIKSSLESCQKENQNNFKKVLKTGDQILAKTVVINDSGHTIKELVKKRNEADQPKPLARTKCASIIMDIFKENHPRIKIKEDTIKKLLQRWDDRITEGKKDLVQGYRDARNGSEGFFEEWVSNHFVNYYINHRNIRKRNNPFDTRSPKISSSDAAQNEAAVQKHRREE